METGRDEHGVPSVARARRAVGRPGQLGGGAEEAGMMRGCVVVLAGVTLSLGGCRDRSNKTDLRTLDADEMARQGKLVLADSQVVSALRTPNIPGRIVYDAP